MLKGLLALVGFNLTGEIIVRTTGIPIPAAVIGMVLLFAFLLIKGGVPESIAKAGQGLIDNLGVMFVPAGAGITLYLGLIAKEWDVILIASLSSTTLTLIICGLLFQTLHKGKADDVE